MILCLLGLKKLSGIKYKEHIAHSFVAENNKSQDAFVLYQCFIYVIIIKNFEGVLKMQENNIGKTLNIIGILTIAIGILGSLILSINLDADSPIIFIGGSVASFISGMSFIGFGEIISLLQKNVDKQDKIIDLLEQKTNDSSAPKSVLQDIESNLPEM